MPKQEIKNMPLTKEQKDEEVQQICMGKKMSAASSGKILNWYRLPKWHNIPMQDLLKENSFSFGQPPPAHFADHDSLVFIFLFIYVFSEYAKED